MGIDPAAIGEWLRDAATALGLFKSAAELLPKGKERDRLEGRIAEAEEALGRSHAAAAKELGFYLCKCKFPPPVMLWREQEEAFVCENQKCGHRLSRPKQKKGPKAPSGPYGWMAR